MSGFDVFPHQPLSDSQKEVVLAYCGIDPIIDYSDKRMKMTFQPDVTDFVAFNATAIVDSSLGAWLNIVSARTAGALEDQIEGAEDMFTRGAFFYGGVLNVANSGQQISYDIKLATKALLGDPFDFAVDSKHAIEEQVPSFVELAEEVRPALHTDKNDRLHDVVLMGAGALHSFVAGSYDELRSDEMDRMLEQVSKAVRDNKS